MFLAAFTSRCDDIVVAESEVAQLVFLGAGNHEGATFPEGASGVRAPLFSLRLE
jgi:hypothetical protein